MVNYSIIIPVKAINQYVRETVPYIQSLDNNQWELIIVPNELDRNEWDDKRIRMLSSGRVGPATKRDLGAKYAHGEILVFLDDDSYPSSSILSVASQYFNDRKIVAIGGPAITPRSDSFWQKVSGAVFLSKYSGGSPERYTSIGETKEIDDWPSVNFMVRREEFLAIGGFSSQYWPGEDTKLCLDLVTLTNKKILYVPNLIVWHHRRAGILEHLKQIGAYGLHRGYFAKKHPKTSRRLKYFFPTLFALIFFISPLYFYLPVHVQYSLKIFWIAYAILLIKCYIDIIKYESVSIAAAAISYIPLTHFYYGIQFLRGIFIKNLVSKLR